MFWAVLSSILIIFIGFTLDPTTNTESLLAAIAALISWQTGLIWEISYRKGEK